MTQHDPLMKVRFEGEAVGASRIPVAHLMKFLDNLTKALVRTGRVLSGESQSVQRGPQPRAVKDEVSLDIVTLTHGSPAAVLGFERHEPQMQIEHTDRGLETFEKALKGLVEVQGAGEALPAGFDVGVLMAWRDVGSLFEQGVSRIEFSLNHREKPVKVTFTPDGFQRIQTRIKGPETNIRTIEGRLLMADFKEHGTRCRVHPSAGDPVLCLFDEAQKEEVLEDMLHYVRIVGEAKEDQTTGKITSIRIHDIERLEDKEDEAVDLLPQRTPIVHSFWESPTLDELASAQAVQPMADVHELFGTWPGDEDDGFEAAIDELRHAHSRGNDAA